MKKNTVVLFYPKTTQDSDPVKNIPLSILKLGSELKGAGYDVVAIDERFEENYAGRLKDAVRGAVLFGVSVMTGYQIKGALRASALVKSLSADLPVVWGGWHPSILPEETLAHPDVDIVVRGQGERTICGLAHAVMQGGELAGIDGISYKEGGRIVSNKARDLQDVNTFFPLRFDIVEMDRYISAGPLGQRSIFWNSSQGCPYHCGFCSTPAVYKRRWSGLAAGKLLDQLESLISNYGIDGVTFAEDNFFVDTARIEQFCKGLIDRGIRIRWATDARVDQITRLPEGLIRLLKESGCSKLYIGAESGDEEVLNLVDKKITVEDIYKAAAILDRHKIISEFFMIVGFPLNPKKDLDKSLELIRTVKIRYPDHQFTPFLYTPYPGTPLLDVAVRGGLKIPASLEGWIRWSILSVSTPWVDGKYLDTVNMYTKCFFPLAFPSASLTGKMRSGFFGFAYRALHGLALYRVRKGYFRFPIEWKMIKAFNAVKTRFNIFKKVESFR